MGRDVRGGGIAMWNRTTGHFGTAPNDVCWWQEDENIKFFLIMDKQYAGGRPPVYLYLIVRGEVPKNELTRWIKFDSTINTKPELKNDTMSVSF